MVKVTKRRKNKTILGIDENYEAVLAYLFGWISGLVFLLIENKSKFVRFHAMQSFIFFLSLNILMILFSGLWIIGSIIVNILFIIGIIAYIVLIIKALSYENFELPFFGELAKKFLK